MNRILILSYAQAVQATPRTARKGPDKGPLPTTTQASPPAPPPIPQLAIGRENTYRVDCPGSTPLGTLVKAFQKDNASMKGYFFVQNQLTLLQLPQGADPTKLLNDGFTVGNATAKLFKLHNSSNGSFVECLVKNLFHGDGGIDLLKEELKNYGDILHSHSPCWPDTTMPTGEVHVLLKINNRNTLPPSRIKLDRATWTEELPVVILGKHSFCHYCRSTEHQRAECTKAPACKHCHKTSHPSYRCPLPGVPAPTQPAQGPTLHLPPSTPRAVDDSSRPRKRQMGDIDLSPSSSSLLPAFTAETNSFSFSIPGPTLPSPSPNSSSPLGPRNSSTIAQLSQTSPTSILSKQHPSQAAPVTSPAQPTTNAPSPTNHTGPSVQDPSQREDMEQDLQ